MRSAPLPPPSRPATYADLEALPDNVIGEIIHGALVASPRPAIRHARASSVLGSDLGGPFDRGRGGPGGWLILFEPELHLGPDVLVPDLAGWRRERVPTLPDVAAMTLAPDWVCEVLSPSTEAIDRAAKMEIYAREAVSHLWLVNPKLQTLEIYTRAETGWLRLAAHQGDAKVRAVPFDAIELELDGLWSV
ncbi:MAG: Uma2 family endonuclease [Deltaproteobacteria bacterium]|nr:Uma2 family endonuclease [Deltaproteobacteria bacterium]